MILISTPIFYFPIIFFNFHFYHLECRLVKFVTIIFFCGVWMLVKSRLLHHYVAFFQPGVQEDGFAQGFLGQFGPVVAEEHKPLAAERGEVVGAHFERLVEVF